MKKLNVRYLIVLINIVILIISWFLIDILGQGYADNYQGDNMFNEILSVVGYVAAIFFIIAGLILVVSFLGTLIFGLLKKKELFLGFLFSFLINVFLGLIIYLTQY